MKRIIILLFFLAFLSIACSDRNHKEEKDQVIRNDTISQTNGPITIPDSQLTTTHYDYEVIVPDLQIAWGMDFLPDGSIIITQKSGELIHFKDGEKQFIENVPQVYLQGQGGLLDIKLHPDFENNNWLYITYASSEGENTGGNTALMRAKLQDGKLMDKEVLYKAEPNSTRGQHFGSRISFDHLGHLYFSIGDRGNRDENPQDLTRDGGKIYRLNDNGSIPEDNPFFNKENAKKAIFSYGHRNPQGIIFNPESSEIWVHEHGPQGGDEINIIKKGANYGWPVATFGENYDGTPITDQTSGPGYQDPIYYWLPSIAPSGFTLVTSNKYPELKGDLLVGSLKFSYVEHLSLEGETIIAREKILEGIGRVRNIVESPDGFLYISVENKGILKLIPKQ